MAYLVFNSVGFSGYWGTGSTEEEATANWQRHGGRGERVVMLVDDAYEDLFLDAMGNPRGKITAQWADVPAEKWPVFDRKAWLVGPRGGNRRLITVDGKRVDE